MLQHNSLSEQHQNQLSLIFSSLKLSQLLRKAGIRKTYGVSSFAVFQMIFQLVFQGRNLFRLLEGTRADSLPGKDVIYRFLNVLIVNRIDPLCANKIDPHGNKNNKL
jgi:hypothetical protein